MTEPVHLQQTAAPAREFTAEHFRVFTERHLDQLPQLAGLSREQRFAMRVVAQVLPFRVNQYVVDELIDWDRVPDDPIFQLTFPQPGMLEAEDFARIADLLHRDADRETVRRAAQAIRGRLNPHPAGQREMNTPRRDGERLPGLQHKYRETVLFFPSQGPVIAHINGDPAVWARLWQEQTRLGVYPYYMFVERDTGARRYFELPLARAWEIYRDAMSRVSGLSRSARGPSMSAGPGKVEIQGVAEVHGEKVFVLRFIQGRNPEWVQRPFFARFDPEALWLDQLRPAFGEARFFFQDEYDRMCQRAAAGD